MTQKEKARAFDILIAHLRWSFDYHTQHLPEDYEDGRLVSRYHDHNVHAAAMALLKVHESTYPHPEDMAVVCPCDFCQREGEKAEAAKRARESEGNSEKSEGNFKREKREGEG
jgi:hypothetical protein